MTYVSRNKEYRFYFSWKAIDSENDSSFDVDKQLYVSSQSDAVAEQSSMIIGCFQENIKWKYGSDVVSVCGIRENTNGLMCPFLVSVPQKNADTLFFSEPFLMQSLIY